MTSSRSFCKGSRIRWRAVRSRRRAQVVWQRTLGEPVAEFRGANSSDRIRLRLGGTGSELDVELHPATVRASAADTANTQVDHGYVISLFSTSHRPGDCSRHGICRCLSQEVNQKCPLVAVPCQPIDHPESCSSMYSMNTAETCSRASCGVRLSHRTIREPGHP